MLYFEYKNDYLGGGWELHFPDNLAYEHSSEEGEKPKENPDTNPSKTHRLLTAVIKNSYSDCEWVVLPLCKPPNFRKQLNKLALQ